MKKSERIQLEFKLIEKRNKIFLKASPAEKRIMIAEDTIQQLNSKKIIAEAGVYFQSDIPLKRGKSLQDELIKKQPTCNVCQIGGLFASCVTINNDLNIPKEDKDENYFWNYSTETEEIEATQMRDYLSKYFSPEQLVLIEIAFEENIDIARRMIDAHKSNQKNIKKESLFLKKKKKVEKTKLLVALKFRKRKKINFEEHDTVKEALRKDNLAMITICKNIISNGGRFRPNR